MSARSSPRSLVSGPTADIILREVVRSVSSSSNSRPRGKTMKSGLAGADPVSSQLDAYPTKTAAKSPFRPVSDGWRPLGRLCSLASMSCTTLAASAAGRYEQTQLTREPTILGRSPTHQSVAVERANARKTGRQASWTRESIFIFLLPGELQTLCQAT